MSNTANTNTGTGPAPPYNEGPPSMAELIAEITMLRNTVNHLRTRVNEQAAAAPNPAPTVHTGRDPGESLKPPKPEPFRG
ncbi:hypothetical protein ACKRZS_006941 [Fusarium odoratissimum]